jgi:hypothetical protein
MKMVSLQSWFPHKFLVTCTQPVPKYASFTIINQSLNCTNLLIVSKSFRNPTWALSWTNSIKFASPDYLGIHRVQIVCFLWSLSIQICVAHEVIVSTKRLHANWLVCQPNNKERSKIMKTLFLYFPTISCYIVFRKPSCSPRPSVFK